jgi:uncharacterized protein YciI
MLFLVIARDGQDPEAPARRAAVRTEHLLGARTLAERGTLHVGGAMLDAQGTMIGSTMLLEADDEAAVRAILEHDVYHRAGVWRSVEIHPFKRAF